MALVKSEKIEKNGRKYIKEVYSNGKEFLFLQSDPLPELKASEPVAVEKPVSNEELRELIYDLMEGQTALYEMQLEGV